MIIIAKKKTNNFISFLANLFPELKKKLLTAHLPYSPYEFTQRSFVISIMISITFSLLYFMFADKVLFAEDKVKVLLTTLILFIVVLFISFIFMMNTVTVYIKRRQIEIDKEVLFAGRYLLVKMESGVPFFNALIDASRSYGVSGKYFKEIVDDINLGNPIEKALDRAVKYSASEKFKMILWQLTNSLKTGIDTTGSLKGILDEITREQVIEIKRYGKKLNSLAMFYMLAGVIVPSLGMALFIVLSSFIEFELKMIHLYFVIFLLGFIQFMFLSIFRTIRPNVNL